MSANTIGAQFYARGDVVEFLNNLKPDSRLRNDECSFCLENYNDARMPILLPVCYHRFHLPCIAEYILTLSPGHDRCPLCRHQMFDATPTEDCPEGWFLCIGPPRNGGIIRSVHASGWQPSRSSIVQPSLRLRPNNPEQGEVVAIRSSHDPRNNKHEWFRLYLSDEAPEVTRAHHTQLMEMLKELAGRTRHQTFNWPDFRTRYHGCLELFRPSPQSGPSGG